MRPPVPYYGGKQTIADRIIELFPPHDAYIEPFAGGLSVLFAKEPETMEVVNDLDAQLMTFWRVLRTRTDEFLWLCETTPHARQEMVHAVDDDTVDELEIARRVWVRLTQARAGNMRAPGWRNYLKPGEESKFSMPAYLDGYRRRLTPAAERLRNVTLECKPALDIIRQYGSNPNALLYVDPPYLNGTRNSTGYRHEMGDELDHEILLATLLEVPAAVILSGYHSPLYDRMIGHWARHEFGARTQTGDKLEVVWCSRGEPATLFSLSGEDALR